MTGRITAPIFHTAWKAQKISGQFRIMTTTRSPVPTPRERSTAANLRASSSCSSLVPAIPPKRTASKTPKRARLSKASCAAFIPSGPLGAVDA